METRDTITDPPAHHEVSMADDSVVTFTDPAILSIQAHDLENWKAELVRVIDAARHDSNDAESVSFLDGVLSQPAFLQRFTALEILSQRRVSPSWAAWLRHNFATIASARRQDDSRDWYFPVFDPVIHDPTPPSILPSWPLSGIWHATADHSSVGLFHALPPLAFPLPPPSYCCHPRYHVIASSGGLLLVQTLPFYEWRKRRRGVESGCKSCRWVEWRWPSLMVLNPLMKKLRALPPFEVGGIRWWNLSYLAQGQIMVDEEANAYKVLLYSCGWTCYYVYDSRSGSWQNERRIPTPVAEPEFGRGATNHYEDLRYYASACVRRRLYFADIRRATATDRITNPDIVGVLRLLEMDIDTGDWKPRKNFPLRKLHDPSVEIREVTGNLEFCRYLLRNLELVECMGHIFAVIPARIDEYVHRTDATQRIGLRNYSVPDLKHMPLQFYVLQLDGEDVNDGVVRIDIPTTRRGCKYKTRRQSLFERSLVTNQGRIEPGQLGNWFSCTAKGSVIWVSCEDYLVQYDVVSGQSKTQIIPIIELKRVGFAYRASFHMKP